MADTMLERLDELAGRVAGFEGRLGLVERALGMEARVPVAAEVTPPPPPIVVHAPPPPVPPMRIVGELARVAGERRYGGAVVPLAPVADAGARSRKRQGDSGLEGVIGRNWTSWVGGIILVLGTMFFLQYAWEQGWLAFAPLTRVLAVIGAGVALGVAGEVVHRRRMRVLAGALSGAGVAIVMAAFFAAATAFDVPVFSARTALIGVCAAAAVGVWRATRTDTVTLAIIALLGAYLAPAVLRSGRDQSLALMGYLGALAAVGWSLSYLKPRWGALRWFLLACTGLWVAAWVAWYPVRGTHRPLGMGAVAYFFAGFVGEAFLSVHKLFGRAPRFDGAHREQAERLKGEPALESSLATVSMIATAGAFAAFWGMLPASFGASGVGWFHVKPLAGVALGLASLHGMLALATPSAIFSRSSVIQATALVTLAVPLTFGRVAVTVAWGVLAVAMAALAHRRDNRPVRVWAVVLLGLAVARLFTLDLADAALRQAMFLVGDQRVSGFLLLAVAVSAACHAVAVLVRRESRLAILVACAGGVVFFAAGGVAWDGVGLTLLWLVGAGALVAMDRVDRKLAYAEQAGVALLLVGMKWLTFDGMGSMTRAWHGGGPDGAWPVVNATALAGAGLIGLTVWVGRRVGGEVREVAVTAAAALAFAWLNFEGVRAVDAVFAGRVADLATAKQAALSVMWALAGLVGVVVGFARELRPLRYAALALLGLTLAKILLIDLAQVKPVYRILSFCATGALLLCVSFVYHRQANAAGAEEG